MSPAPRPAIAPSDASSETRQPAGLAFSLVIVLCLSAAYTSFHYHSHAGNQAELARATEHLLRGETHWVTFQNRVLGPALIDALRSITGWSWLRAFYVLVFSTMAGGGALLVWHAWRRRLGLGLGLGQATAWFLLGFVFNDAWSYPWDYLGAVLNLGLALWALDQFADPSRLWSWPPWLLLGALALNRESSLIAIASLGLAVAAAGMRARRFPGRLFAVLSLAAAANVALVLVLRRILFERSTRPEGIGPVPELVTGNFLQFRDNVTLLATQAHPHPVRLMVIAIAAGLAAYGIAIAWRSLRNFGPVAVHPGRMFLHGYFLLGTGAILAFAALQELRVYFELIPFLVLLGPLLLSDEPARDGVAS